MRVLFLNPPGQLGGAERSLLDLIASLRQATYGWRFHLIAGEAGPLVAEANALGASSTVLPFPQTIARLGDSAGAKVPSSGAPPSTLVKSATAAIPDAARYSIRLSRAIRDFGPEIVHTNGFKMHILGIWAAPRGVPVVWHIRDYVSRRPIMSRLMRLHARSCAAAVAISRSVAKDLVQACRGRVTVSTVYNAIDLNRYSPTGPRLDLDALAGMSPAPNGIVRIGLLATMAKWKGHETFLRAVSLLDRALPIRAYVIGDAIYSTSGSQRSIAELRALATELGVQDRVGFTGFVGDAPSALRALDVVVHASTEPEPFGRVIAEAMSCQRPVVATEAGGAEEIATHGRDSLLYPPDSAGLLAYWVRRLASDEQLRKQLGRSGRAKAEAWFDRKRLARQVIPLYEQLAHREAPIRRPAEVAEHSVD
jgi:glycosyltransferase involved in cell wall biosynthesis